jgi:hypothetical protein
VNVEHDILGCILLGLLALEFPFAHELERNRDDVADGLDQKQLYFLEYGGVEASTKYRCLLSKLLCLQFLLKLEGMFKHLITGLEHLSILSPMMQPIFALLVRYSY